MSFQEWYYTTNFKIMVLILLGSLRAISTFLYAVSFVFDICKGDFHKPDIFHRNFLKLEA